MTALTVQNLGKTFPDAGSPAVHDVSLTVASGGLTALLGPSGSGKTTIMKMIAGLLYPDSGDILLDGQSIKDLPPDRRRVVMVFQNPLLFPHLTLAQNVGFGLRMRGLAAPQIDQQVRAMLALVHLGDLGHRRPVELSGGQQQRAALARALVLKPDLLLLDEPLSNLDTSLRDEMRDLIRSLQRSTGITTLVVTHDQGEAVVLADHIALLMGGRLAQHGTPDDLFRRPATEAVARFFGGTNFITGRVEGTLFHAPFGPLELIPNQQPGPARLTIRPEALRLGSGQNSFAAVVRAVTFLGTQYRIDLDVAGVPLAALLPPFEAETLTPGAPVTVSFPAAALWPLPG
jgi:ABC-type Fe3+/spermidine/putrescine transport system ATPase subunit